MPGRLAGHRRFASSLYAGRACAVLFDANRVQISPLLPPVGELRPFRGDVRRLYLSATVRVDAEFVRTFGRAPAVTIAPGGRAGDTERPFLLPRPGVIDEEARAWAEAATRGRKTAVMTPTRPAAERWLGDGVETFDSDLGHERVRAFAASADQRLALVARYDGIDLLDDARRVMVVDGLPSGLSLLDRLFEQHLERAGVSDAKIASRFVQLIGRTSRGYVGLWRGAAGRAPAARLAAPAEAPQPCCRSTSSGSSPPASACRAWRASPRGS